MKEKDILDILERLERLESIVLSRNKPVVQAVMESKTLVKDNADSITSCPDCEKKLFNKGGKKYCISCSKEF